MFVRALVGRGSSVARWRVFLRQPLPSALLASPSFVGFSADVRSSVPDISVWVRWSGQVTKPLRIDNRCG
jgi:hypothetical protein